MTEHAGKMDIPGEQPKEPKRDAKQVFAEQVAAGGKVLELENLGIERLQEFTWPE